MALTVGLKNFLKSESFTGVSLFVSLVIACLLVNSSYANFYYDSLAKKIPLNLSWFGIYKEMDVKMWINDAFMAIFFLLVGLELKREALIGELSSFSRMFLPAVGAVGGVVVPALIYFNINSHNELYLKGWAIPTATDIAFAIGILSFFGKRIPNSLKIFLVALAVIDDLVAILIIALFYTQKIALIYFDLILVALVILFILNRMKVAKLWPYLICGIALWVFVLKSGVHATIAGVLLSFFIPIYNRELKTSPLQKLENYLHRPVNYLILPIFAFANAGISFAGIGFDILKDNLVAGIAISLFFGKQLGIVLTIFVLVKLKVVQFFKDVSWLEFYGVSILAGIGFTMSLFIGGLAFIDNPELSNQVTIGVILGSLLSTIVGFLVIAFAIKTKNLALEDKLSS